jgi:hypothetical protein
MVDEWLYTFDEDDDSFLAGSELEGLLKQLRQGSSVTGDAAAALTPQLLMTQVRSVCPAACVLRRKKTVSHCIRPPPLPGRRRRRRTGKSCGAHRHAASNEGL